jgi:exodeoxyribonuclease V gamma subunit
MKIENLSGHMEIQSKHVTAMIRNPIKFHMNQILQMYLQTEEDRKGISEESLILSPLERYQLKQLSLKKPFEKVMKYAEQEGILPFGLFKDIAKSNLKNEIEDMHNDFHKYSIDPTSLSIMEFSSACFLPTQINKNHWLFPSPQIYLTEKFSISIIGKVTQVSSQGLIAMNKGSLADLWKVWPQFLLFCCGAKYFPDQFEMMLILPEANKEKRAFFDNPHPYLSQLSHYYLQCTQQFSPLIPEWIPFILEKNSVALQQKMTTVFSEFFGNYSDPYLKWVFDHKKMPDAESIVRDWNPIAKEQLGAIADHWISASETSGENNERI